MILRNKEAIHFVIVLVIVMGYMTTPSTAGDDCVWCKPSEMKRFLNCCYKEFSISPYFNSIQKSSMEDLENSMVAAANAITKSDTNTKMNIMNGAMAGGMGELIKNSCRESSSCPNADVMVANLLGIVETCYTKATGSEHIAFLGELENTVTYILKENKDTSEQANSQAQAQANSQAQAQSISSTTYNEQNPRSQTFGNQQQIPLLNRQFYNYQQPAGQNYLAQSTSQANANANAAGSTYPNNIPYQSSSFGRPLDSSYSEDYANQQNFYGSNPPNNNYGNTNLNINQNIPVSNVPAPGFQQNYGSWNTPSVNNPIQGPNRQQNGVLQNNAANYVPNQGFEQNYAAAVSQTGVQNSAYNQQNQAQSYNGATSQSSSGGNSGVLYNQPQTGNDYALDYSFGSAVASSSADETQAISYSSSDTTANSQQRNLPKSPKKDKKPKPIQQKPLINKPSSKAKEQSSLNKKDDQTAKDSRFAETFFSVLIKSSLFNQIYNQYIIKEQAVPITYYLFLNALNDCGYQDVAGIAANDAVVSLTSVRENSSGETYAEDFTKVLLTHLCKKNFIGNNPESQATNIAKAFLERLKEIVSAQSSQPTTSTESSSTASPAEDDQQSHTEVKFYEALFYRLSTSKYFQTFFNQKTSKISAKLFTVSMLRSLSPDYGSTGTVAANDCSKQWSTLSTKRNTDTYADYIARVVTAALSNCNMISYDAPSTQAEEIAAKLDLYLKQILDKRQQTTTVPPTRKTTSNWKNDLNSPGVQSITTVPTIASSGNQPSTGNVPNDKFNQQNKNGYNNQDYYDDYYYDYYYGYPAPSNRRKNQNANQQNKMTNQQGLGSKTNQQTKKPTQPPFRADSNGKISNGTSNNGDDYYYYYYYDDNNDPASQTDQQNKAPLQQAPYQPSDNQQNSGKLNYNNFGGRQQNISPDYYQQYPSQQTKEDKPKSTDKSNAFVSKIINKLKPNNSQNSKTKSGSGTAKPASFSNSNVQNNEEGTSQGNNYNVPVVPNAQSLSNPSPGTVPDQTSLQIPSQTFSNDQIDESKERIQILMQWAKSSVNGDNFDYKLYSSVIAALVKYLQDSHPDWDAGKAKTTILIECIVAITQLLTKSPQGCPQNANNNPSVDQSPQMTEEQANVVQNFQIASANVNSPASGDTASQQIPLSEKANLPVQDISAIQQQTPPQNQGNFQSGAQYFSEPQQIPSLGQSNVNSAIQGRFVPQQMPLPDQQNVNPVIQDGFVYQQAPFLGQTNVNPASQGNFAPYKIPALDQAIPVQGNVSPPLISSSDYVFQQTNSNNQQSFSNFGQNNQNQQGPALWPSTVGQGNPNIPDQGAWNMNDQSIKTSSSDILNGNPNFNTGPPNQGNWGLPQEGLINGNPMATNPNNGNPLQATNQRYNDLSFIGSPNPNIPQQGNQQNWGSAIFPKSRNLGVGR